MPHIVVDEEQARIIAESAEIEMRDRSGKHLGYVAHGFTDEDIAIARERMASKELRYTTQEVLDHVQSLERK